ncbi:MAG: enoyl-CoA hydratase [Alphaproteobacteria bacterium]|jgi:enoyl-CoA hydratase/carnithine racemase|nr:enoyl-CoA hydratase [Alphaproteobacteria bacterium]
MSDIVTCEFLENATALVRINRPEALNALNMALRKDLAETFLALQERSDVRAIVLTGDERAFAAGADLKEFVDASAVDMIKRRAERYWQAVASTPQPVIAAIRGYAMGGGLELAMACDLIVVGENAQLGQPEIKVGIMPGAGGTQRLTRAVGKFNAMKINLLGKPFSGRDAFNMGLACEVCADEDVLDTALKMAKSISHMPPLAAQAIKEAVVFGESASLETGLLLERKSFQVLFATEDRKEGMEAFIEKRKPSFSGK